MTVTQNGAFLNAGGTVVSLVFGFSGTPPAGQTFQATVTVSDKITAAQSAALAELAVTDATMHRIAEAVALGLTAWTTADVVAWVNYRRTVRAMVSAQSASSLPARPAYPVGT